MSHHKAHCTFEKPVARRKETADRPYETEIRSSEASSPPIASPQSRAQRSHSLQRGLDLSALPSVSRSVGHGLRMVFLPVRIRESPLSPSCSSLADAAYCRHTEDRKDNRGDGDVDCDLGACGEAGPALSCCLGGWSVQSICDRGVASERLSVYRCDSQDPRNGRETHGTFSMLFQLPV